MTQDRWRSAGFRFFCFAVIFVIGLGIFQSLNISIDAAARYIVGVMNANEGISILVVFNLMLVLVLFL